MKIYPFEMIFNIHIFLFNLKYILQILTLSRTFFRSSASKIHDLHIYNCLLMLTRVFTHLKSERVSFWNTEGECAIFRNSNFDRPDCLMYSFFPLHCNCGGDWWLVSFILY